MSLAKKTRLMRATEDLMGGQKLETALGPLVTRLGLSGTAQHLGVKTATLNYWLLKFGIQTKRIAVAPGAQILLNGEVLPAGDYEP